MAKQGISRRIVRGAIVTMAFALCSLADAMDQNGDSNPLVVAKKHLPNQHVTLWFANSLTRVFPLSTPGSTNLSLLAARNSRIAFQACLQNNGTSLSTAKCSLTDCGEIRARVRAEGFVPLRHLPLETPIEEEDKVGFVPGLVPDPLYPTNLAKIGALETQPFWITLDIPNDA